MRNKSWIKDERWGSMGDIEQERNPICAPPPPTPSFGADGLFSLACAEQLEQYSCEEMDGWRGGLDSVHLKKLPFIRAFWH